MKKKARTTSWIVTGLGTIATILGQRAFRGRVGAGLTGFGVAHVLLGILDMTRPTVRIRS